jgi:hypothetical protein
VISITSVACLAGRRREALILSTRHPAIVNQSIGRLATRSESHGHSRPSGQDAAHPLCRRERPCDAPGYTLPVGKLRERDESCRDDSTELGEVLSLKILPSGAKLI